MGIVAEIPTHEELMKHEKELVDKMSKEIEPIDAAIWLMTLAESVGNKTGYEYAMYLRAWFRVNQSK